MSRSPDEEPRNILGGKSKNFNLLKFLIAQKLGDEASEYDEDKEETLLVRRETVNPSLHGQIRIAIRVRSGESSKVSKSEVTEMITLHIDDFDEEGRPNTVQIVSNDPKKKESIVTDLAPKEYELRVVEKNGYTSKCLFFIDPKTGKEFATVLTTVDPTVNISQIPTKLVNQLNEVKRQFNELKMIQVAAIEKILYQSS